MNVFYFSNFPREIMGLRNLLISNNLIEYVVPGAFDQFKSLEALDLSSNNLKTIITRESKKKTSYYQKKN